VLNPQPTSVNLPVDLLAKIKALAAKEGRPRNQMIRVLLEEAITARASKKGRAA